ncbi:MAG TPA: hypothetical protein VGE59_00140 [Patescibacteria group bacterium]
MTEKSEPPIDAVKHAKIWAGAFGASCGICSYIYTMPGWFIVAIGAMALTLFGAWRFWNNAPETAQRYLPYIMMSLAFASFMAVRYVGSMFRIWIP